jgi:tRNA nucleotidyltransferase (CCA-adding enzyme)
MDAGTQKLARAAVAAGALATVSGPRVRDELLDLLAEPSVEEGVRRLRDLGVARALHPALDPDPQVVAAAAREGRSLGADRALAALGALALGVGEDVEGWLGRLGLTSGARSRAARAATRGPALARALTEPLSPADLHALLRAEPPEALAVARALGAPEGPVRRFVDHLRHVRLEVTGRELIAAGVPPSPRLGRALEETLRLKLDGEVSGREEELRAALEVARAVDGDTP